MIAETALKLAGDQAAREACLVARPIGVAHVYAGPLTPSGRFVPRAHRTVCRAHTRQLRVLPPERPTSLARDAAAHARRLCARCQVCLGRDRDRPRQTTSHWLSRAEARLWFRDTTKADVAFALELATTPAEVDAAAWLSLLLFDVAGCNQAFTEHDRTWPGLHDLVAAARYRVRGFPDETYALAERHDQLSADAADQRRQDAKAVRDDREARIQRLGFHNAVPGRPRRGR